MSAFVPRCSVCRGEIRRVSPEVGVLLWVHSFPASAAAVACSRTAQGTLDLRLQFAGGIALDEGDL